MHTPEKHVAKSFNPPSATYAVVGDFNLVKFLLEVEYDENGRSRQIIPWLRCDEDEGLKKLNVPLGALNDPDHWLELGQKSDEIIAYDSVLETHGYKLAVVNSLDGAVRQYRYRMGSRLNLLDPPHFSQHDVFCRGNKSIPRKVKDFQALQHLPWVTITDESEALRQRNIKQARASTDESSDPPRRRTWYRRNK